MISFVWNDRVPMYSGRGGVENFTAGHVRELASMGIESRVITIGLGANVSNDFFPDIEFFDVDSIDDIAKLDDTIIFLNLRDDSAKLDHDVVTLSSPHNIKTLNHSYVMFHCPPLPEQSLRAEYKQAVNDKTVITTSNFMRAQWAKYLGFPEKSIPIVSPFADPHFAHVQRPISPSKNTTVLFAGRLMAEKGVYLYLECIHHAIMKHGYTFTITNAGNQTEDGRIIETILEAHPGINLVEARHTPADTAELLAQHDIIVMPSNKFFWHEGFGMLSVEGQHAGSNVIASDDGGLPETDCGGLTLFESGNSMAMAEAIRDVAQRGPATEQERSLRSQFFTRRQSVESFLKIIDYK